jgi:hypothetical protein
MSSFIVIRRENGRLRPSPMPAEHNTLAEAVAEAERLAGCNPGIGYEVFAGLTVSTAKTVQTEMLMPSFQMMPHGDFAAALASLAS